MPKEPSFEVKIDSGESSHGRVPVRKVTEKLNNIEAAITQCAEVLSRSQHKKTGRRKRTTRQVTELFFSDLRYDSFGATITVGHSDELLFTKQEIEELMTLFKNVIADVLNGTPFKTLQEKCTITPSSAKSVLRPFYNLMPTKEDDTLLEIKIGRKSFSFSKENIEPIVHTIPEFARGGWSSNALVFASVKHDKDGNVTGISDKDNILLLADSKTESDELASFSIKQFKAINNEEGQLTFNQVLLAVVRHEDDVFTAVEPTFQFSAVGESEVEAVEALQELIVATYFLYANSSDKELTGEAQKFKRKLKRLVVEAVEAE